MRFRFARLTGLLLLGLAEAAAAAIGVLAAAAPAAAQLDDRFPFLEDRRRRYQQPYQPPQNSWGSPYGYQEQRQAPVDSSRAPAPRRTDAASTMKIVVFGDSMADWLAYGLEEAFGETPEIGILRKHRTNSGLIRTETRNESYDWPTQAREMLNAEKADFVVMMIGLGDRRGIREAIRPPQPARPPRRSISTIFIVAAPRRRASSTSTSGTASSTRPAITTITARISKVRRDGCAPATACISPAPARASSRITSSARSAA